MIREDKIGTEFIGYYNGSQFRGTVQNDPSKFDLYRKLGLDVFKNINRESLKPLKPVKKPEVKSLSGNTASELRKMAKDLKGYKSGMKKNELIELINADNKGNDK